VSIRVTIKAKRAVFRREAVLRRVEQARERSFYRIGGLTRTIAANSMRRRKNVSDPGTAPTRRSGELKRLMAFDYDRRTESVVIGPIEFANSGVPNLMEYGGRRFVRSALLPRRGAPKKRPLPKEDLRRYTGSIRYRPRPSVRPALVKTRDRIPGSFAKAMARS